MALSKASQLARKYGYGTLKEFRKTTDNPSYKAWAASWAAKHGVSEASTRRITSKFARRWGRAFYRNGEQIDTTAKKYTGANQRLARLAVEAGLREPDAAYRFGAGRYEEEEDEDAEVGSGEEEDV